MVSPRFLTVFHHWDQGVRAARFLGEELLADLHPGSALRRRQIAVKLVHGLRVAQTPEVWQAPFLLAGFSWFPARVGRRSEMDCRKARDLLRSPSWARSITATTPSTPGMARQADLNPASRNFRTAFCECFGCSAESFQEELLRRGVPASWRPLASVVRRLAPGFFRADLEYLGRVGATTDWLEFKLLANGIPHDPGLNHGLLRKGLHLRISGHRLFKIYENIAKAQRESFR